MRDGQILLEIRDLIQDFDALRVLSGINMTFRAGEITGIIGPNGAGKTTLFNAITGNCRPVSGSVLLEGEKIDGLPAWKISRKGLARTFQNIRLFKNMTVLDHVLAGMNASSDSTLLDSLFHLKRKKREDEKNSARAEEILRLLGLWDQRYQLGGSLPYGAARKLEIARALATRPKILLLDEPAAGMNEQETEALSQDVRRVRDQGYTILLIEHDLKFVMNLCDYIYVLDHGEQIGEGTAEEITENQRVIEAYIGSE